jgi:Protein of unknown function (DUF4245)
VSDSAAQHRAKQTVRNLILSLLVSIGLMVALILGVPRDDSNRINPVDYVTIAAQAQESVGTQVLAPEIPESWWANGARLENNLGVQSWYVGFVTPDNQFIGLSQAFESNPSWLAQSLQGNWQDGEVEIEGKVWKIYPTLTPSNPPGTREYAMVHEFGSSAVVIFGTAKQSDFNTLAGEISKLLN